jgi:hypothetical protein
MEYKLAPSIRCKRAADLVLKNEPTQSAVHKQYIIDQMLRILLDADYPTYIDDWNSMHSDAYGLWDVGIPP